MFFIQVTINKFISNDQPGLVECSFTDAWGKLHLIQDKLPVFTELDIDANSQYPQKGVVGCEIIKKLEDQNGKSVYTVDTSKPWDVSSIEGLTTFDLFETQIIH